MAQPPIHVLCYGDSGAGKSTGVSTFPKPMLLFSFDPFGKETPYLKRGEPSDATYDNFGTPVRHVLSKKTGQPIIQIEYYLDADPTQPEAYQRFLSRMSVLHHEYDKWATVVLDSSTFAEIAARKWHQYKLNPSAKDPRQWYGGSTELLEEMLMIRFGSLPMNVVTVCHIDEDKDELHGFFVRNPMAPGKLKKKLPSAYGEFYRAYVTTDEKGDRVFVWQTRADKLFNAGSQIGAPDPCAPTYQALWTGQGG